MQTNKQNTIVSMTFDFAKDMVVVYRLSGVHLLPGLRNQLFRSGTSIGANVREAQNAESKADFVHKLKIAAKEADETQYWLDLAVEAFPQHQAILRALGSKLVEIQKVLSKIIATCKKGMNVKAANTGDMHVGEAYDSNKENMLLCEEADSEYNGGISNPTNEIKPLYHQTTKSTNYQTTKSSNYQTTKSSNYQTTKSSNYQIGQLSNHPITQLPNYQITKSPN